MCPAEKRIQHRIQHFAPCLKRRLYGSAGCKKCRICARIEQLPNADGTKIRPGNCRKIRSLHAQDIHAKDSLATSDSCELGLSMNICLLTVPIWQSLPFSPLRLALRMPLLQVRNIFEYQRERKRECSSHPLFYTDFCCFSRRRIALWRGFALCKVFKMQVQRPVPRHLASGVTGEEVRNLFTGCVGKQYLVRNTAAEKLAVHQNVLSVT